MKCTKFSLENFKFNTALIQNTDFMVKTQSLLWNFECNFNLSKRTWILFQEKQGSILALCVGGGGVVHVANEVDQELFHLQQFDIFYLLQLCLLGIWCLYVLHKGTVIIDLRISHNCLPILPMVFPLRQIEKNSSQIVRVLDLTIAAD